MATWEIVREKLTVTLDKHGFECYPFKIEWYNQHVAPGFQLDYPSDTLAFAIVSTPSFFEKTFIPFLRSHKTSHLPQDPLDQCIAYHLKEATTLLSDHATDVIHDFEMRTGTRRPKVLVQTAGHVSGAAYFYQKSQVLNPPWPPNQAMAGICLHPRYVGWFALRGVIVIKDIFAAELPFVKPEDILEDEGKVIELLNLFNFHWKDWRFRDVVKPVERYSDLQQQYFSTLPTERGPLIEKIKNSL